MSNHKPTAVQDAKGYYQAHPERKRPAEPTTSEPLGPPPERLSADLKTLWHELAAEVLPGVAKQSDRTAFELLVKLTLRMRNDELRNSAEMTQMISLLGRFALTPADRSKVVVSTPQQSALSKFLSNRKPAPIQDAMP